MSIPSLPQKAVLSRWPSCSQNVELGQTLAGSWLIAAFMMVQVESTKWKRLYWVFLNIQRQDRCANRILDFIQSLPYGSTSIRRQER